MNSSPISNCWHSKLTIFILCNINSLLQLHGGTHIIYVSDKCNTPEVEMKKSNSSLKTRGAEAPRTRITWRLC